MHELLHRRSGQDHADQRGSAHRSGRLRPLEGKPEKPLGGFGQVKIPMGASAVSQRPAAQAADRRPLPRQARPGAAGEAAGKKALVPTLQGIADEVLKNPARFVEILREKR
jgi:hypothetical protein